MSSVPSTVKALVLQGAGKTAVVDVPMPIIDDDEILVKVIAVALNPTDWKRTWQQLILAPWINV